MKKRIVLCADDYGQADTISLAIVRLIEKNRLSATTCMVNTPDWLNLAPHLLPFKDQIDVGLHFNLTEGKALSTSYIRRYGSQFFSLTTLLRKAFLHRLDSKIIERECAAQIEHFVKGLGFLPHFIDGHQHVHQFPVIREALLNAYEKYLRKSHAYIRLANERPDFLTYFKHSTIKNFGLSQCKKMVIYASGAHRFAHLLQNHSIPHNQSFAGIYSFPNLNYDYDQWFQYFLAKIKDGGLIMCHPGRKTDESQDAIALARQQEYDYLSSHQFLKACSKYGILLSKFGDFFT